MPIIKRGLFCPLILVCLCACPYVPPSESYISDAQRSSTRSVGVVSPANSPTGEFIGPRGGGAGAMEGAANGTAIGVGGAVVGCILAGPGCLVVIELYPGFVGAVAVAGAVSGGVVGAARAVRADDVNKMESRLKAVLAEADPQRKLRLSIIDAANQAGVHGVTEIAANILSDGGREINYRKATVPQVDAILEVTLVSVSFVGQSGSDNLVFHAGALVRLVDAKTNVMRFTHDFTYDVGPKKISEWNANEGRMIRDETENAYRSLGQSIVDEVFLVLHPIGGENK
jgi:hypothetical protein